MVKNKILCNRCGEKYVKYNINKKALCIKCKEHEEYWRNPKKYESKFESTYLGGKQNISEHNGSNTHLFDKQSLSNTKKLKVSSVKENK